MSWLREDVVLFAAGACHILAHMFLLLSPNEDFDLIYTKPVNKQPGNHMYVSGRTWAFDFNRWSLEEDLLKVNERFGTCPRAPAGINNTLSDLCHSICMHQMQNGIIDAM